jgi:hypothetical protein
MAVVGLLPAADESRDVSPMTVVVVRPRARDIGLGEVEERLDAARKCSRWMNARVNERHRDPGAGAAPGGQPHGREGRVADDRVVRAEPGERRAGGDHRIDGAPVRRGTAAYGIELGCRELHQQRVDGLVLGPDLFALCDELLLQPGAITRLGLHNHPRRTTFAPRLAQ